MKIRKLKNIDKSWTTLGTCSRCIFNLDPQTSIWFHFIFTFDSWLVDLKFNVCKKLKHTN